MSSSSGRFADFPDVSGGLIIGTLALIVPWWIAEWLGVGGKVAQLIASLGVYGYAAHGAIYFASFYLVGGVLRGLLIIIGVATFGGNRLIEHAGQGFAAVAGPVIRGIGFIAAAPFVFLWRGLVLHPLAAFNGWQGERKNRQAQERKLRSVYESRYRNGYASFREFRRAFYAQEPLRDGPEDNSGKADDAGSQSGPRNSGPKNKGGNKNAKRDEDAAKLAEAFELFDLPVHSTKVEFEARYRALMKQVHPDIAGPNGMARKLNEARLHIRVKKGWM